MTGVPRTTHQSEKFHEQPTRRSKCEIYEFAFEIFTPFNLINELMSLELHTKASGVYWQRWFAMMKVRRR